MTPSVSRPRRPRMRSGPQDEADAAHGVQDPRLAVGLELAAQVADEDVGHVRAGIEGVAPDLLVQAAAVEDLAGVAQEELEQLELAAGQAELAPAAPRGEPAGSSSMSPAASRSPAAGGRRRSSACRRAETSSSANGLTT